ncbi:MAG: porin family protein [Bacteroidota bacterium]|nr:porin family protein [Bacteroidota bacterium]
MKKLLPLLILAISVNGLHAQKLSGGLKAGVNITNFTGPGLNNIDKKALVGFNAGGFLNLRFGAISLQPEVLVSTAGAKYKNADSSFKLTYLSVPVMLKYRADGGFYVEIGPQVGFKLGEDISNKTIGDFAKDLDLSAAGGLGFQTKRGLGIGARYLLGLSKVGNFQPSAGLNPDFKNSVIQVGISFPLGK